MPIRYPILNSTSLSNTDRMVSGRAFRWRGLRTLVCLIAPMGLMGTALQGQQPPSRDLDKPYLLPEANRVPDPNDQMAMRDKQGKQQNFSAVNAERKKQIASDSAKLVKLTEELKAEANKTDKDALSLTVIREAEEIERLAHNIKEKMKLMVGGG
jgi:hypothetical protein